MSAIRSDAPDTDFGDLDTTEDAANAFMSLWEDDADEPSSNEEEGTTDDTDTEESDTTETDADEQDGDAESDDADGEDEDTDADTDEDADDAEDDEQPAKVLDSNAVTKFKVDGKEVEVKVADLQRLYGQEAALTRKSQEVATKRKEAEDRTAAAVASSEALLTRAKERFAPYNEIDWARALKELQTDEFNALRGEAQRAYQDIEFFEKELGGIMEKAHQTRHTELIAEAQATLSELTDPVKGIKGFTQEVYSDMHSYATNAGVPKELMDNLVSAPVLRLLHKAMMYDRGAKAITKTKDLKPKKIVKGKVNSEATTKAFSGKGQKKAMARLEREGSLEAGANAFLEMFSGE